MRAYKRTQNRITRAKIPVWPYQGPFLFLKSINAPAFVLATPFYLLPHDGTRPSRSNLLFHNRSYPGQAVIGDEAPQVDNGVGEFTLPAGFEYLAQASVQCDGERTIETRESRPVQEIAIQQGMASRGITFTIPGPRCSLWEPK